MKPSEINAAITVLKETAWKPDTQTQATNEALNLLEGFLSNIAIMTQALEIMAEALDDLRTMEMQKRLG